MNFVFTVPSVMHEEKRSYCLPMPYSFRYFNAVGPFCQPKRVKIRTLKVTKIVAVHQYATSPALIVVPELNTCRIKTMEMMVIVPGHQSPTAVPIGKLLMSRACRKLCREHLKNEWQAVLNQQLNSEANNEQQEDSWK